MSEIENAQSARVVRDDELDLVSGGFRVDVPGLPTERCIQLENTMINN